MTANDDTNSESDNSTSRSTTRDESPDKRSCLPIAARVQATDWISKEKLALEFGLTEARTEDCLAVLEAAGDVDLADLGTVTLAVAPGFDVEDAVAELSDEREREWRAANNWKMPDRGDFQ